MAASEDVPTDINPVAWWKSHAMELPKWANAFRLVLLVQPSSAAAERVFSILQRFTAQQQSSLEDYLELSNTTLLIRFSNFCLHFNYSMQKRNFWKAKWVKERAKWVNQKRKIGRFIKHKRKAKWNKFCQGLLMIPA